MATIWQVLHHLITGWCLRCQAHSPSPKERRNTNAGLAGISPVLSKFEARHLSRVLAGVIHIPQLSCFCEQRFGGSTLKHHKLHRLLRIETQ
jgi:hypothetical protein